MNIFLIVVILFMLWKIYDGYKKGMVKEIISFISLLVLAVIVLLVANGMQSYLKKDFLSAVVMVLLLCILGIVHHILGLVFFSAKLISKLPIIHTADKLLGIVFGVCETVIVLWIVYSLIMLFDIGMIGQQILSATQNNGFLLWIYQHNVLANFIQNFSAGI